MISNDHVHGPRPHRVAGAGSGAALKMLAISEVGRAALSSESTVSPVLSSPTLHGMLSSPTLHGMLSSPALHGMLSSSTLHGVLSLCV